MPYLLNVVFDLYTTIVLRPGGKNRTIVIKNSLSPILRYTETNIRFDLSISRLRSIHLKGIERSREARYTIII
jgi:hypothetical protein